MLLINTIQTLISNKYDNIFSIAYHGGEPLLNFDVMKVGTDYSIEEKFFLTLQL